MNEDQAPPEVEANALRKALDLWQGYGFGRSYFWPKDRMETKKQPDEEILDRSSNQDEVKS